MNQKLNCVLVIDDDEPTNFLTQMILEESGYVCHIKMTQSGQEALGYLAKSEQSGGEENHYPSPDIIFLDINMPTMDGWEFLDEYKKLAKERHSKAIVVMLTTSLNPDDRIKAAERPEITCFEIKPLTEEKINRILKEHFRDHFTDLPK